MEVTVAVATFGDPSWKTLATQRAIPSAQRQAPVVHAHAETLAEARNKALERVETEWVIFLDADDELERGYVHAMSLGEADLRAPAVSYVKNGRARAPHIPRVPGHRHACSGECLPEGNWIVIGAAVRADLVRSVGGFEEWPVYEDWALWLRCWKAGASSEPVTRATYRAHWRRDSRNRAPDMATKNATHHQITEAIL